MRKYIFSLFFVICFFVKAQKQDSLVLKFNEYIGYVKKFHPIAKQAELTISLGQANLMKSRGGFDPKLEFDYDRKEFKGTQYWERINATFKVPTWYGIELKGNFEQNDGAFINPSETAPNNGLYSAGVSASLARGFWINERMATLKKAKFFREQTKVDRDLLVNQVLFDAALAYFDWLQAYKNNKLFADFLTNSKIRFEAIKKRALAGDIAAIDTVEAKISVQNRALELEQSKVRLRNTSLELSNFLWLGANIPTELQPNVIPDLNLEGEIDTTLEIFGKPLDSFSIVNHPKLKSLEYKIEGLKVDKQLKSNKLLPKIDLEYNFLTETPEFINSLVTQEYKGGLNFRFPLFLRKERGDLKLSKLKLKDAQFELNSAKVQVQNKVLALYNELESLDIQNVVINDIVVNYTTMLSAEERKFSLGESSLFLINSRENKLIEAVLKQNLIENKYFTAKAKLFNTLVINPESL